MSKQQRAQVQALRAAVQAGEQKAAPIAAPTPALLELWLEGDAGDAELARAVAEPIARRLVMPSVPLDRRLDLVTEIAAWLHDPRRRQASARERALEVRDLWVVSGGTEAEGLALGEAARAMAKAVLAGRGETEEAGREKAEGDGGRPRRSP